MPPGSALGSSVEPGGLVRLEHLDARRREEPEHGDDGEDACGEQDGELPPAEPDEEQDREERRRVDERRPEVGLHEHEQDRQRAEPDHREDRPPLRGRADPVDDETGDGEHEQHLSELGRLELDHAEVEPALGAADRLGRDEDDDHERQGRRVDELPVPAPDVERDERHGHEPDRADGSGERLPEDEVPLVARDVEARDPRDHPEPVAHECGSRRHEDPVEAAQEADDGRLGAGRAGADA